MSGEPLNEGAVKINRKIGNIQRAMKRINEIRADAANNGGLGGTYPVLAAEIIFARDELGELRRVLREEKLKIETDGALK